MSGMDGSVGARGDEGATGVRGERGEARTHVFATHSFNSTVPECPGATDLLWEGYSLATSYNNPSLQQALANPNSCMRRFSMLMTFADLDDNVGSSSYWNGAEDVVGSWERGEAVSDQTKIRSALARCSVCELQRSLLTVHSGSTHVPECPPGWGGLWTGFSYLTASVSAGHHN